MSALTSGRERRRQQRRVIITGIIGVVVGLGVVIGFLVVANRNGDIQLGERVFVVGGAQILDKAIDRDGPILFPDPLKRSAGRNLYVQHVGPDFKMGWLAFEAQVDDPHCQVVWERSTRQFRDPCTDDTYPLDGGDLRHYPAKVDEGRVVVDLRLN